MQLLHEPGDYTNYIEEVCSGECEIQQAPH
jgi:hypothetical protein